MLLLTFGVMMVIGIPLGILDAVLEMRIAHHAMTAAFLNLVSIGAVCAFGLFLARASFSEVYPLRAVSASFVAPMAVLSVGLHVILSEVDNIARRVSRPPEWMQELFEGLLGASTPLFATIFLIVIVAPLTEEFLFRGLILRGFLGRYSRGTAIVASALLFGAFHGNIPQGIAATALGIVYGWWFVHTRSLIPCILGHALNNGLALMASRATALEIPGYTVPVIDGVPQFQPWWFNVTGLALTLLGGLWLYLAFARENAASRQSSHSLPAQ